MRRIAAAAARQRRRADASVALPPVAGPMSATPAARGDRGDAGDARAGAAPAPPIPWRRRQRQTTSPPTPARPRAGAESAPRAAPRPGQRRQRAERGSFVVQLGSFGSRENADRLVRDMTAKGFAAFVAPITSNGRELYRVRVGPTRDRASAEALAARAQARRPVRQHRADFVTPVP